MTRSSSPPNGRDDHTPPGLEHLTVLAHLLDRAFRIPGTRWRFGLDALIGLIPGLGDMVGAAIGLYSLWVARQIGAPGAVQIRMLMNLTLDGFVGFVPLVGDLFDFAFKAHSRNHSLLVQWLKTPHQTRRSSWAVIGAAGLVLCGMFAAAIWVLLTAVHWAVALFTT